MIWRKSGENPGKIREKSGNRMNFQKRNSSYHFWEVNHPFCDVKKYGQNRSYMKICEKWWWKWKKVVFNFGAIAHEVKIWDVCHALVMWFIWFFKYFAYLYKQDYFMPAKPQMQVTSGLSLNEPTLHFLAPTIWWYTITHLYTLQSSCYIWEV